MVRPESNRAVCVPLAALAAACACLLVAAGALAQPSGRSSRASKAVAPDKPSATARPVPADEQVDEAIERGLAYLFKSQQGDGAWPSSYAGLHAGGVESLVVYTALSAGKDSRTPAIQAALKYIDGCQPQTVYARALRALAYARLADPGHAKRLAEDVQWLLGVQDRSGGWGYGPGHPTTQQRPRRVDNSNSQLAALALAEAADAGAPVPQAAWEKALRYWSGGQNDDGGWGYEPPGGSDFRLRGSSYGSMTAAGVASLLALGDRQAAGEERSASAGGANPAAQRVAQGLAWLTGSYSLERIPNWVWGSGDDWLHYYLHCFARAAAAAGVRDFGPHDWWAEMAAFLVDSQQGDGSWADPSRPEDSKDAPIRTCFALLSLLEGRRPVLLCKLVGPSEPPGEGRDVANFTRWYARTFSVSVGWQRLTAEAPQRALAEAPVVFVNGRPLLDEPFARLVEPLARNGQTMLVQVAPDDLPAAQEYFLRLLPDYHAEALPKDHPVFHLHFDLPAERQPAVMGLGDYGRMRVFLVAGDLSGPWQRDQRQGRPEAFQLAANVILYATDIRQPRGRLSSRSPAPPTPQGQRKLAVARVRHAGDWNACPLALPQLDRLLSGSLSMGLAEAPPLDLSQPPPAGTVLAWMTGSIAPKLTAEQRQTLKEYVQAGGTLFVDSAFGRAEFLDVCVQMLTEMFPHSPPRPLGEDHELLTGRIAGGFGADLRPMSSSRPAQAGGGQAAPRLWAVTIEGRAAVILSRDAVTCGLEGQPTYGCPCLPRDDARRLAANVVLYAAWKHGPK